jgi:hypothetical protein
MKQDSFIDFLDAYGRANPHELPYNEDRDFKVFSLK